MILQEKELVLRAIEMEDWEILKQLINSPEIEETVVGWSKPISTYQQQQWISHLPEDKSIRYMIQYELETVGTASISLIDHKNAVANLNIKLLSNKQRLGIGTKVIRLMSHYCFEELNIQCITASILEKNIGSRKLFEKCGFIQEGILRRRVYKQGEYQNLVVYSLLRNEQ